MKPSTRAFLDRVRYADDPTSNDAARVRAAVAVAIAGSAVVTSAASTTAATSAGSGGVSSVGAASGGASAIAGAGAKGVFLATWYWVGGGIVAVGLSVGGYHLATRTAAPSTVETVRVAETTAAPRQQREDPPEASAKPPASALAAPEPAAPARALPAAAPSVRTSLDADLELLESVSEDLRAGHEARALERLDRNEVRIASSALAEELRAARIVALCQSGKLEQGRALARALLAVAPRSPQRHRIDAACQGDAP